MKKKSHALLVIILSVLTSGIFIGCKSHSILTKKELLNKIHKKQAKLFKDDILAMNDVLSRFREQCGCFDSLDLEKQDTLFILELFGVQGNYGFTMWNSKDTISCTNATGNIEKMEERLFSLYMMNLLSEWNLSEIRKEEKENSGLLPSDFINGTRIIVKDKEIETIRFKDFFNLERDTF